MKNYEEYEAQRMKYKALWARSGIEMGFYKFIVVPNMKYLDIAVQNGIKPSEILLNSEIKFSQEDNIPEVEWIMDEAQEFPESVYRVLSRFC